jgi:hypothetical protein
MADSLLLSEIPIKRILLHQVVLSVAHCNKTIPSASVLSSNRFVPASFF